MNSCEKIVSPQMKWSWREMNEKKNDNTGGKFYRGTSRLLDDYHQILTNFLHKNALNWLLLKRRKK